MDTMIAWLEAHEGLSGWAQFLGAVLALFVTYVTAFAPSWRRKRQLEGEAKRLLMHGYEVIESFYRTSAHFAPFALSLRQASLSMTGLIDDIGRFPVYELDNNFSSLSVARRLMTMRLVVSAVRLLVDTMASDLETRPDATASEGEWADLRTVIEDRLKFAEALVRGTPMTRPEWPADSSGIDSASG